MTEVVCLSDAKYVGFIVPDITGKCCETFGFDEQFVPEKCRISDFRGAEFLAFPLTMKPSLEKLQFLVDGNIELVGPCEALEEIGYNVGYVNEEGKLKDFPLNEIATILTSSMFGELRGPVIFLRETEAEAESEDSE